MKKGTKCDHWTFQDIETLVIMKETGCTYKEISQRLGRSRASCVSKYRHLDKSSLKKISANTDAAAKIKEMTDEGIKERDIAEIIGMSLYKVKYIKRRFGIFCSKEQRVKVATVNARVTMKDSICWVCKNAMVKCTKPVEGWTATKKEYGHYDPPKWSYLVMKCPNFDPEPYANRLGEDEL